MGNIIPILVSVVAVETVKITFLMKMQQILGELSTMRVFQKGSGNMLEEILIFGGKLKVVLTK
ncbi:hypothetical protein D3C74_311610 [compost metagenome]